MKSFNRKKTSSTNLNLLSVTLISCIDASAVILSSGATAEMWVQEEMSEEMWDYQSQSKCKVFIK